MTTNNQKRCGSVAHVRLLTTPKAATSTHMAEFRSGSMNDRPRQISQMISARQICRILVTQTRERVQLDRSLGSMRVAVALYAGDCHMQDAPRLLEYVKMRADHWQDHLKNLRRMPCLLQKVLDPTSGQVLPCPGTNVSGEK